MEERNCITHSFNILCEEWEYTPTRDDNKIGPLTDFDSYWFSLALNFEEYTASTWRSGNTLPPVTTTKSDL
ncbi:hypothetical protein V1477_007937 [Vespula maculifrons]|uniref:Uncharacterized protein n=1 Tax=Vespula maculifrons TaxID=7453 RepID=A0ABD2CGB6_VESMC